MTKYRVLVDYLRYPTDPRILRRLAGGEQIPFDKRGMCEPHSVGDIVDDVPRQSVAGLVKAGWIEPLPDAMPVEEVG